MGTSLGTRNLPGTGPQWCDARVVTRLCLLLVGLCWTVLLVFLLFVHLTPMPLPDCCPAVFAGY